ncbi:MAG: formylglycine-generating enzyme family protein [Fibromonadaceae bacterium]|jgi:hypothetical protein|nr:formylglycine-generating enzyme family protein [Fibromonadaceae bacterium]
MKTNAVNHFLLTMAFAVLMSASFANAQLQVADAVVAFGKFVINENIKSKEAREKISEIQSSYETWSKLLNDYSKKTGSVGDCKTIGFEQLSNNSEQTKNFSYECGVREDGKVAYLDVKSKSKIGNCEEASKYGMKFDIRKQYFENYSFPVKNDCIFFEVPCELRYVGSCPKEPVSRAPFPTFVFMKYVKGGLFEMGSSYSLEMPIRRVKVNDFCISNYQVTQKKWQEIMGNNPSHFKDCDNCPVEQVSWDDTQEFIKKLNAKTGMKYRLLTEAEWEYAARGGCASKNYKKYCGSDNVNEVAWNGKNSKGKTHPVGEKKGNELGLLDMCGNVREWVSDWYGSYKSSDTDNPKGPNSGSKRVTRGGSGAGYDSPYDNACEVSTRGSAAPNERKKSIGFRLAHPPIEEK